MKLRFFYSRLGANRISKGQSQTETNHKSMKRIDKWLFSPL